MTSTHNSHQSSHTPPQAPSLELLSFTIENFRSFLEPQTLSFEQGSTNKFHARQVTGIFGANASGKSNTALALYALQRILLKSASADFHLPYSPFFFQKESTSRPTSFSVRFSCPEGVFIYSISYDGTRILSEQLKEKNDSSDNFHIIFSRNAEQQFNPGAVNYGFNKTLLDKTRPDTLVITKAVEDNEKYARIVFRLVHDLTIIGGDEVESERATAELLSHRPDLCRQAISLLGQADFTIRALGFDDEGIHAPGEPQIGLRIGHFQRDGIDPIINSDGRPAMVFTDISNESVGTGKFLSTIVHVAQAVLEGKTLYLDEFGAYLSNKLIESTVALMQKSPSARFILNTHSDSLMDQLDRKSVIIIEKRHITEESVVSSLSDKISSKVPQSSKRFRQGDYGGVAQVHEELRIK